MVGLASVFVVLGTGGAIPGTWPDGRLLASTVLLLAAPYVVSFAHPTYHLPAGPLLAVMAGWGLGALREHADVARLLRRRVVVAVAVVLFIQFEWTLMMIDRI